jgi:stage III sporulation protein AH
MFIYIKRRNAFAICMLCLGLGALFLGLSGLPGEFRAAKSVVGEREETKISPAVAGGGGAVEDVESALSAKYKANNSGAADSFFVEYRLERERTRGQQLEMLREVISSSGSGSETGQRAQEQLMVLSQSMARESEVESLVKARGYMDAAAYMDRKGVTVIVRTDDLSAEDGLRIKELVARCTGAGEEQIMIIPKS